MIRSSSNKPHRQSTTPYTLRYLLAALLMIVMAGGPGPVIAQAVLQEDEELAMQLDEMLTTVFPADAPGAAVIVVRDGRVILRKGYGLANLELGVPVQPEMVFRLASVTKQFTAMAILMLSEEGKLALDDDITQYLPDYPTHGQTITIEYLLTHTGGIKEYSGVPTWPALSHSDVTPQELIAVFQDEPLGFAPGEHWAYSNSGYILLGAIIEKVSGLRYAEFIQQRIFTPLGMTHSYYDDSTHLIPGRVAGYTPTADGYVNAEHLSMTHAYAAGALASSVDDLARWDAALYTNKLVKAATLRRAFKAYTLKNGQSSGYGYGWSIANYEGHPIEEHDGGINGFNTIVMRLPADKVYIAILTNNGNNPVSVNDLALTIATLVIGQPYQDPPAIMLPATTLATYEGVYLLDEQVELVVRSEGIHLSVATPGEPTTVFTPFAAGEFFGDAAHLRLKFVKNAAGEVTAMQVQRYFGPWRMAPKLDKPLPALPEAIEVDPAILADYVGQYEAPGLSLAVTPEGDSLMVTPAGEEAAELVPTAPAQFAVPAFNAQIEFVRAADGAVSGLVVHVGGQEIAAEKVN